MRKLAEILAVLAAVGMFVVLVMGATVTSTGSEHGCGRSWPLCHGQFIPQFAVQTFIEFSHRAVVGVESTLILALAVVTLLLYRSRQMRVLVGLMVAFLFLQAGLGAWAVMAPQLAVVIALHFGVSLIAFSSTVLVAVSLFEMRTADQLRARPIPGPYRRFVWGLTTYTYVVVYLGAYVRHTHAELSCLGWPLCSGHAVPPLVGGMATSFVHRVAAFLLLLAVAALVAWTRRLRQDRPDLYLGGLAALASVLLQVVSGAVVAWTRVDLFSALSHAALAGLLFASLSYLCLHVLPVRIEVPPSQPGHEASVPREPVAAGLSR